MASWHRFFLDFDRFWEASWDGNRSQDRPKKASKNDAKKKSSEIAKKRRNKTLQPLAKPRVLGPGEVPPLKACQPLGAAGGLAAHCRFKLAG